MADSTATVEPKSESDNSNSNSQPDPSQLHPSSTTSTPPPPPPPNPNPVNNDHSSPIIPPPLAQHYAAAPSFRPAPQIPSVAPPQFAPVPLNATYSVPGLSGPPGAPPLSTPSITTTLPPYAQPGQLMRLYPPQTANGYPGMFQVLPRGSFPSPVS